jgi:hypothetical protein
MSLHYSWSSPDIKEIFQAYGEKFKDTSFFDQETFEEAKKFVDLYCVTEIVDHPGRQHLLLLSGHTLLQDLSKILLDSNKAFYSFLRSMLDTKRHLRQVLDNVGCSRELAKFSHYVNEKKAAAELQLTTNELSGKQLSELMFWSSDGSDLKSLDISSVQLPVISFKDCSSVMSELLVWLCHPSNDTTIPPQVIEAFLFTNAKLVESQSCLTSTQFSLHWLYLHLSLYFRIIITQHRIGALIDKGERREEFKYLDNSEIADRFVLLTRLAAVLGFTPPVEFQMYVRELDVGNYVRYNHFGMLDIVFSKISVEEYNWPIQAFGIESRQDVIDTYDSLKEVVEAVESEELRERLTTLLKECKDDEFSELKFTPSETLSIESLKITEDVKKPEESELSFSITEPGGWDDIDVIPE